MTLCAVSFVAGHITSSGWLEHLSNKQYTYSTVQGVDD